MRRTVPQHRGGPGGGGSAGGQGGGGGNGGAGAQKSGFNRTPLRSNNQNNNF